MEVGFEIAAYDPTKPLIIDPILDYSTYLGGGSGDTGTGIAVDGTDRAYVTGATASPDFPTTAGAFDTTANPDFDAFVVRLTDAVCGDGIVNSGEQCDPGSPVEGDCCSATCQFESATVTCRAAAGVCDVADTCSGTSGTCGSDLKSLAQCRAAVAGGCDVAESCDGIGNDCPPDGFATSGTACGDGTDTACDNPNTCNGTGTCQDNFEPSTTECRAVAGECDIAETCTGNSTTCPTLDVVKPANTACTADNTLCTQDICDGVSVQCTHPTALPTTGCTVNLKPNKPCIGTSTADIILGTSGNDVILGGAGTDTLYGQSGNDIVCGQEGNDRITGDLGNDHLNGGPGTDTLNGGLGTDTCIGGEGSPVGGGCEVFTP